MTERLDSLRRLRELHATYTDEGASFAERGAARLALLASVPGIITMLEGLEREQPEIVVPTFEGDLVVADGMLDAIVSLAFALDGFTASVASATHGASDGPPPSVRFLEVEHAARRVVGMTIVARGGVL